MPFYDWQRSTTTNGSANTSTTHSLTLTVANQETLSIMGVFGAGRFSTAGGGMLQVQQNTGTAASGGTTQAPIAKNLRTAPTIQSTWKSDASAITAGGTLAKRLTVGFAQTGGQGGYVPLVPGDAIQMQPNGTNPVDLEINSLAASASVPIDITVELCEGSN